MLKKIINGRDIGCISGGSVCLCLVGKNANIFEVRSLGQCRIRCCSKNMDIASYLYTDSVKKTTQEYVCNKAKFDNTVSKQDASEAREFMDLMKPFLVTK